MDARTRTRDVSGFRRGEQQMPLDKLRDRLSAFAVSLRAAARSRRGKKLLLRAA
jgi:hypothetical protein